MLSYRERRKSIAPESSKTKRAREKLRKHLEEQDLLITPQALADTVDKIYKKIADNVSQRVLLENKEDLRLFDHNTNPARLSSKVAQIAKMLQSEGTHAGG